MVDPIHLAKTQLRWQEKARTDFFSYIRYCSPDYIPSRFNRFLARKLQEVAQGKGRRVIINTPPRMGKTRMIAIEMPTFLYGMDPSKKVVLASYGQDLSLTSSKEARARMETDEYQALFKTRLLGGDGAANAWGVSGGGRYKAVGVGSALTGHGADLLLIDDVVKDFADAHSPTILEKTWNWFWSVAYTRLSPDANVVILMTRWSCDDLVGRLTDKQRMKAMADAGVTEGEWEVINLPALAHMNDPIGREVGESLFPERFTTEKLLSIKAVQGSYIWSALYDGNPVRAGGNYIPVQNFIVVEKDEVPTDLRWVRFWDTATTTKETSDFTASPAVAMGSDGFLYIKDMQNFQAEWPAVRQRIVQTAHAERYPTGMEAVGGFKSAYQNLLEVFPSHVSCRDYNVEKDKLTRALPWIAMVEAGKVKLVRGDWITDFIIQAEQFPNGLHDDMVDGVSGGYQMTQTAFQVPKQVKKGKGKLNAFRSRSNRSMVG